MKVDDVFGRDSVLAPTAGEAVALDRAAIEITGIPGRLLMENAGRAAALVLDRLYPRGRVVAALGRGNNGGDGLVLLRCLRAWGREVAYFTADSRTPNPELAHEFEIPRLDLEPEVACAGADLVVDAILGTGVSGAPREPVAGAIRALNRSGRPVVSLDLPTGVDPTSGQVPGEAVHADATITFGWPKRGLLFHPGRAHCGRLIAVEIGFPPGTAACELITPGWARSRLPDRPPTAHKAISGRLLVLAGRKGMAGAALVAAEAALRAGAGYLWLASDEANRVVLQTALPEAIFVDRTDRDALLAAAASADALLAGPGIGVDDVARELLETLLDAMPGRPALLDADALTLLGQGEEGPRRVAEGRDVVMTPHPGEMARLTGLAIEEITGDPIGVASEFAERTGCVIVLKGSPSVVASPGEPTMINTVGSSDLARAGMGDQLAGVIGALLAAGGAGRRGPGPTARDAAGLGLFYSGRAADLLGRGRSLSPRDLSAHLDRAFAEPGPLAPPLGLPFITFDQPARW